MLMYNPSTYMSRIENQFASTLLEFADTYPGILHFGVFTDIDRRSFGLRIAKTASDELRQLRFSGVQFERIEQETWRELSAEVNIVNINAAGCAIVYIWDPKRNVMLSGHFSIFRHSDNFNPDIDKLYQDEIRKTSSGIWYIEDICPDPTHFGVAKRYVEFLARVRTMVKEDPKSRFEAYLFGQNLSLLHDESPAELLPDILARQRIVLDLIEAGILIDNIADYRALDIGTIGSGGYGDDTVYIGSERIIYLDRGY